jgi:hypothetical protein
VGYSTVSKSQFILWSWLLQTITGNWDRKWKFLDEVSMLTTKGAETSGIFITHIHLMLFFWSNGTWPGLNRTSSSNMRARKYSWALSWPQTSMVVKHSHHCVTCSVNNALTTRHSQYYERHSDTLPPRAFMACSGTALLSPLRTLPAHGKVQQVACREHVGFFPWRWDGSDPSVDAYLR